MRVTALLSITLALLTILNADGAFGGGKKRPERILAVKFQVQHAYRCTSCAISLAEILRKQEGVREVRTIAAQDAAVAFFESGKADIDEMKNALKSAGFNVQIVGGPTASNLDGRFEEIPLDELGIKRPTVKETRAKKAAEHSLGAAPARTGSNAIQQKETTVHAPPAEEMLPVPNE